MMEDQMDYMVVAQELRGPIPVLEAIRRFREERRLGPTDEYPLVVRAEFSQVADVHVSLEARLADEGLMGGLRALIDASPTGTLCVGFQPGGVGVISGVWPSLATAISAFLAKVLV